MDSIEGSLAWRNNVSCECFVSLRETMLFRFGATPSRITLALAFPQAARPYSDIFAYFVLLVSFVVNQILFWPVAAGQTR
ncbi:hypothetical protein [Thioalkalivibrio denitrificans]|uniref:hypothetical protein n=1 Tax=Thioalkalivibrio denitrificans TaxID=108003 RepID=UPI001115A7B4|nr:hypothetical protein [Thioalkalivibrio denitrificans]